MRHGKGKVHLNRTSSHRLALFRNLAVALFKSEAITTTLVKAKVLRTIAEPLVTLAKKDTLANRRLMFAHLRDRAVVGKMFTVLGPRYKERRGGYLRVLKSGFRVGDKAPMALVEFVDREREEKDKE